MINTDLLTRAEVADFLRCGSTKLWELEKDGLLRPTFRLGRRPLWRRQDVLRFVEQMARNQKKATR